MTDATMVIQELENRNLELSSLLKSSEKSRAEMEVMIKDQNNELTALRANKLIIHSLEEEMKDLNQTKLKLMEKLKNSEEESLTFKKREFSSLQRINEMETEIENIGNIYKVECLDLKNRLSSSEDRLMEKDEVIAIREKTVSDLFEKCNMLGVDNNDIKEELKNCLQSETYLKEFSQKIQFCKTYLEEQINGFIQELKVEKFSNNELRLEMVSLHNEITDLKKQVKYFEENAIEEKSNVSKLTDELKDAHKLLNDYESGDVICSGSLKEMKRHQEVYENDKKCLETVVQNLKSETAIQREELKRFMLQEQKWKADFHQIDTKIKHCEAKHIEKEDYDNLKNELELKYKLEMNTQLQKVSESFEQEQEEFAKSIRSSIIQRKGLQSGKTQRSVFFEEM